MIAVGEWLGRREPAPPPELARRIAGIAGDEVCGDQTELSRFLIEEAAGILIGIGAERSDAVDLLVADALITYALEAAAENCSDLDAGATAAMNTIARAADDGNS